MKKTAVGRSFLESAGQGPADAQTQQQARQGSQLAYRLGGLGIACATHVFPESRPHGAYCCRDERQNCHHEEPSREIELDLGARNLTQDDEIPYTHIALPSL